MTAIKPTYNELLSEINFLKQKLAEFQIHKSKLNVIEDSYRLIAQKTPDHLLIQDTELKYVLVINPLLGMSEEKMMGKTDYDLLEAEDAEKITNLKLKVLSSGESLQVEVPLRSKNGKLEYFSGTYVPRINNMGEVDGIIGYFRNVTDKKAIEDALIIAKKEAEISERRLRSTLDELLEGCQIIGFDWKYIYINKSAEKHNRRPASEMIGKKYSDFWPETALYKLIKKCLTERKADRIEFEITYPDGGKGWFDISIQPISEGVFILTDDISDRKNAENLLLEERVFLEQAQEIGSMGTWELNLKTNILKWTNENYKIFGVEQGTPLTYDYFISCVHSEDREYVNTKWTEATNGNPYDIEHRIIANGKVKWVREKAILIFDSNGDIYKAIGVTQDITSRKIAENILKENEAKLRELNLNKDKFFNIIAHDLRSPFNALLGFSQLLLEDYDELDDHEKKNYISMLTDAISNTYDLVENLLTWSMNQSGRIKLYPAVSTVKDLVNTAVCAVEESAKQKEIGIYYNIHDEVYLRVDEATMTSVFRNLLTNAIKFTPRNGNITIETNLKKNKNKSYVDISFIDNGIGMTKEKQETLFNIEKTQSMKGTEQEKGTGLGLLICKDFVAKNNGTITMYSEPGVGSTFCVSLPQYDEKQKSGTDDFSDSQNNINTILIADDEIINFELLDKVLSDKYGANYNLIHVLNGKDAVDICRQSNNIDLVFMDLNMPVMSGIKATREIRALRTDLPVIIQTANFQNENKQRSIEAGCTDFLEKPIKIKALKEIIEKYISRKKSVARS